MTKWSSGVHHSWVLRQGTYALNSAVPSSPNGNAPFFTTSRFTRGKLSPGVINVLTSTVKCIKPGDCLFLSLTTDFLQIYKLWSGSSNSMHAQTKTLSRIQPQGNQNYNLRKHLGPVNCSFMCDSCFPVLCSFSLVTTPVSVLSSWRPHTGEGSCQGSTKRELIVLPL